MPRGLGGAFPRVLHVDFKRACVGFGAFVKEEAK